MGTVTIPETEEEEPQAPEPENKRGKEHSEIQWLLLKLGSDMGFDGL